MATGCAVGQVTVFSGAQRRRRWSLDEKLALVEASMAPGASIADVARASDAGGRGAGEAAVVTSVCRGCDQAGAARCACCRQGDRDRTAERQATDTARRVARAFEDRVAGVAGMIPIPGHARVWIATGHTDMRKGMASLALLVQEGFGRKPHGGDLYVFRGRRGDLLKIICHDGVGASHCTKHLERGKFIWPVRTAEQYSTTVAAG